jgi:hypothetical protein
MKSDRLMKSDRGIRKSRKKTVQERGKQGERNLERKRERKQEGIKERGGYSHFRDQLWVRTFTGESRRK